MTRDSGITSPPRTGPHWSMTKYMHNWLKNNVVDSMKAKYLTKDRLKIDLKHHNYEGKDSGYRLELETFTLLDIQLVK